MVTLRESGISLDPDEIAELAEATPAEIVESATVQDVRMPYNAVTGVEYQGRNIDRLLQAGAVAGYDLTRGWAGYRQWLTVGRVVRKGEHGTACLTLVTVDKDSDGNGGTRKPRGFRVFHFDQTAELGEVDSDAS